MKKHHNILKLMVILMIIVLDIIIVRIVSGSNREEAAGESGDISLYDRGLGLIESMNSLAGDDNYRKMIGMSQECESIINDITAMDYTTLKQVYRVTNIDDIMNFTMYMSGVDDSTFKGESKDYIKSRYADSVGNVLMSSKSGVMALATSSIFTRQEFFVDKSVTEPLLYVYIYEDAYPVLVSYIPGLDGAVSAKACYLIIDGLIGADTEAVKENMAVGVMTIQLEEINK